MNTTVTTDEHEELVRNKPGASLAAAREQRGYSREYVAGKLHLRVRLIELLESDSYSHMPEPVFIQGYLRGYAKLLDIPCEPLIDVYNRLHRPEKRIEKALWQSRRETNRAEYAVRWLTGIFAVVVLVAVALWWYTNKGNEDLFPKSIKHTVSARNQPESEIRLTDLSKMRSLLSSNPASVMEDSQGE